MAKALIKKKALSFDTEIKFIGPLTDLSKVLLSDQFHLGGLERNVASLLKENLAYCEGVLTDNQGICLGETKKNIPNVSFSKSQGILGPNSYGFINNTMGIFPFAAPLRDVPLKGSTGVILPSRELLPDIVPLLIDYKVGVSWVISVGDGDPAEVARFLMRDRNTRSILFAVGKGIDISSLQTAMDGDKKIAFLAPQTKFLQEKEQLLLAAMARRKQHWMFHDLDGFLTCGKLLSSLGGGFAQDSKKLKVSIVCFGGGASYVAAQAKLYALPKPKLVSLSEEVPLALREASAVSDMVVLCGNRYELPEIETVGPTIKVESSKVYETFSLIELFRKPAWNLAKRSFVAGQLDENRYQSLLQDLPPQLYELGRLVKDEQLSDHDSKRLLRSYGVKVCRQAPAFNPTMAVRMGQKIGFPNVLMSQNNVLVLCTTPAQLKSHAIRLFSHQTELVVRESLPDAVELTVQVTYDKKLGNQVLWWDNVAVLLPLIQGELDLLADNQAKRYQGQFESLREFILNLSYAVTQQTCLGTIRVLLAQEPVVIGASLIIKR